MVVFGASSALGRLADAHYRAVVMVMVMVGAVAVAVVVAEAAAIADGDAVCCVVERRRR